MKQIIPTVLLLLIITACGTGYGIYHRIGEGETLDEICAAYGVSKETVARENYISDVSKLKAGDAIWIPGASIRIDVSKRNAPVQNAEGRKKPYSTGESTSSKKAYASLEKVGFIWPLEGAVVTPFGHVGEDLHDGIDIAAEKGAQVKASAAGRIIYSGSEIKGYGNMVIIKHEGAYSTVYAQNEVNMVKKGDFVKKGDVVAVVGNSGKSGRYALHFEIRVNKAAKDPLPYLP